jgi:hypothetical protein
MHRTRNAAYGQPYRGFESLPLRQLVLIFLVSLYFDRENAVLLRQSAGSCRRSERGEWRIATVGAFHAAYSPRAGRTVRFSRAVARSEPWKLQPEDRLWKGEDGPFVRFREGFRMSAATAVPHTPAAGVRKPPREETALGEPAAVPRALWGFDGCRPRARVSIMARMLRLGEASFPVIAKSYVL